MADELRRTGAGGGAASRVITEIMRFPSGQLLAIASYARRALAAQGVHDHPAHGAGQTGHRNDAGHHGH